MDKIKLGLLFLLLPIILSAKELPIQNLQIPSGFNINLYANIKDARQLALGDDNVVYVGTKSDKVYAILPNQKVVTIASGLNQPNGVAFHDGDLYVAEINRLVKFPRISSQLNNPPQPQVVTDLPVKKTDNDRYENHHALKTIGFSPDNKLFVAVGVPCNSCIPENKYFGTIISMNPDGTDKEIYASGVRNSVGFDWDPLTKQFWFTDNGRDWMGDNLPPDKLENAPTKGLFFGYPYFHGLDASNKPIPDPEFGKLRASSGIKWPAYELPAHVAALGMTFYTGNLFPPNYRNQIIIAEHGSWNRSKKIGYRLSLVTLDNQRKPISYQPFVEGWEKNESTWGRPVDALVMPDGSLLVSDDYAGVVYRITYNK